MDLQQYCSQLTLEANTKQLEVCSSYQTTGDILTVIVVLGFFALMFAFVLTLVDAIIKR